MQMMGINSAQNTNADTQRNNKPKPKSCRLKPHKNYKQRHKKANAEKEKYIPLFMHKMPDKACCQCKAAKKPRQNALANIF